MFFVPSNEQPCLILFLYITVTNTVTKKEIVLKILQRALLANKFIIVQFIVQPDKLIALVDKFHES